MSRRTPPHLFLRCCDDAARASTPRQWDGRDGPGFGRVGRSAAGTWWSAVAMSALAACAPALDWREVPIAGTELVGRFPCHPTRVERNVEMNGRRQQLALTSCDADGVSYGVLTTDVEDPGRVDEVLAALADSARRGVGAVGGTSVPLAFPGVTPYRGDIRLRIAGRRGDGQGVEESIVLFARGTRVFQATAVGSALPPAAVDPFLAGLHFRGVS